MNAAQVLDHFDRISDAPDAIPRLRRFILDLAVRGKLVEQDPSDEPASELLKRIQEEKGELTKDGKTGKHNRVRDNAEAELPFPVPETWEWTPATYPTVLISDVGKKLQTKDVLQAGKFPVVDQGKTFIRGYCNDADKVIYVKEPVIIFGDHTRETKLVDFDFVVGADGVKILKPIQILPAYYFLTLQWLPLDSRGYGRHFKLLRAMKIPLPPLAEQYRIVPKLDELMALCDRLEAAQTERESRRDKLASASLYRLNNGADADEFREHARFHLRNLPRLIRRPEQISQLKDTILQLAVTGKLSEQRANDDNGLNLIEGLTRTRRKTRKHSVPDAGESPESLPPLPATWTWATIGQIAAEDDNAITDGPFGANLKTAHYIKTPGYRVIRLQNIARGYFRQEHRSYVDKERFDRLVKHQVFAGDLVVAGLVDPLVRCCEVPDYIGPAIVKADCYRFKVHLDFSSRFALYYLNSAVCQRFAAVHHHGMTLVRIGLGNFRHIPIPVPPLAEQQRIVAKVDELFAICDRLEAQLTTTQTESRRLLEAVLHEALYSKIDLA